MSDLAWDLEDETDGVDLDVGGGVKVGVLGGQLEEDDDDLLGSITMLLTLTEVSHTGSSPFLGLPLPLFLDTISSSPTPSVSITSGEGRTASRPNPWESGDGGRDLSISVTSMLKSSI